MCMTDRTGQQFGNYRLLRLLGKGGFAEVYLGQHLRLPSQQAAIGTIRYMAPEQIQGHPRPTSDQYALGIAVYEWLTGECPFNGSFTEIAAKHAFAAPAPLSEKRPALSPDVERVVMTALAKD